MHNVARVQVLHAFADVDLKAACTCRCTVRPAEGPARHRLWPEEGAGALSARGGCRPGKDSAAAAVTMMMMMMMRRRRRKRTTVMLMMMMT